jgi:hypothetical protein
MTVFEETLDAIRYRLEVLRNPIRPGHGIAFDIDGRIELLNRDPLPYEKKLQCLAENPHLMHAMVEGMLRVGYLHINRLKKHRNEYVRTLQKLRTLLSNIYTFQRVSGKPNLEDFIYALVTVELYILQIRKERYNFPVEGEFRQLRSELEFMQKDVKSSTPPSLEYPYANDLIHLSTYSYI